MYKVLKFFTERFDDNFPYSPGDQYPRIGFNPPNGRADALADSQYSALNRTGEMYLKKIKEPTKKKAVQETQTEE